MQNTSFDIRVYLQPAFLICAAVLATAGAGMSIGIKTLGLYLEKEPLPLKKSLALLNEEQLGPYRVLSKDQILNEDVLKELGTEEYIQWVLEDTDSEAENSVKRFLLFVTYYGLADRVPHVPEECLAGVGFQRLVTDSVVFEINQPGWQKKVQGRYLVFGSTKSDFLQSGAEFPVVYIFKVNGEYASTRNEVRIALNKNLFGKYSYFSKVELVFNQGLNSRTKQEVVKASEKALGVILPILEQEHWPEWGHP
jgi:hypothetical protein